MSDELLELALRIEAASGPDRELDARISAAIGGVVADGLSDAEYAWLGEGGRASDMGVPAYTGSLDASMSTLANFGVLMSLSDIGADGLPLARVGVPGIDGGPIFTGIASCIMTDTSPVCGLALSVCAASLRARASHLRMEVE